MKKLLTILLSATTLCSFAQTSIHTSSDNVIINSSSTIVSSDADNSTLNLPGGAEAFKEFLSQNLEQPEDIQFGGQVTIQYLFVVDADGSIDNIIELPDSGKYDKEVVDIMNELPCRNLKEQQALKESAYFILPVTFVGEVM